jgi:hypothetical protein
MAGVDVHGGNN